MPLSRSAFSSSATGAFSPLSRPGRTERAERAERTPASPPTTTSASVSQLAGAGCHRAHFGDTQLRPAFRRVPPNPLRVPPNGDQVYVS
jgi:hypothetical protein